MPGFKFDLLNLGSALSIWEGKMLHECNVPLQTVHVGPQVDPIFEHFFDADLLASYTSMMGCPQMDAVGSLAPTSFFSIEDDSG